MSWNALVVAPGGTHHLDGHAPVYAERFDEVLKFHAPGLAPVRRGRDAWHIDVSGRAAYPRRFARTFGYYEGLAAVADDDGWHHIDAAGLDAYAGRHAWCGNFQEGRCPVREMDGAYLHITADGLPVYAARWRYAGDFRDGIAVVQGDDGQSTHIDKEGRLLHDRWFFDLDVFHKRLARARDDRGWTHIGQDGEPVHGRRFAMVEPFYNGQARVERFDNGLEVIDERGDELLVLRRGRPVASSSASAMKVLLIGLPGAGKTTVGALVAERTGRHIHRLDDLRRQVADGSIAGEYLARSMFLRLCGTSGAGVYEFSATGHHRVGVRQAFRESGEALLTVWVDTPSEIRQERLARRDTRVPLPNWGISPGAHDEAMEAKVRADLEAHFWEASEGWKAMRVDGSRPPSETADAVIDCLQMIEGGTR